MSCGCGDNTPFGGNDAYNNYCNTDTPYPIASAESVPSLIANLTQALYGQITKDVYQGKVVWNIPCDPNNTAYIAGLPREPGEGLMCYFIRYFNTVYPGGILGIPYGGTGADNAADAVANLGAVPTTRSIITGLSSGLAGGGNLTADRSLSIANTTVIPGTYGSQKKIPVIHVNARGQLTEVTEADAEGFAQVDSEVITASAQQTVFTLTTITYAPGTDNLAVYRNGLRLLVGLDYVETNSTTVTLTRGVAAGNQLLFESGRIIGQDVSSVAVASERITASAQQTVFTLSSISYVPGNNSLAVYSNGLKLSLGLDYVETNSNTVTLTAGADAGDQLTFEAGHLITQPAPVAVASQLITATAGQTVFSLTSVTYAPGTLSLSVYRNGLKLVSGTDYTETNSNTVTLTSAAALGDQFVFEAGKMLTNALAGTSVGFLQAGTGAVTRNMQDKARESFSVKDFGAIGDGTTNNLDAFAASITAAGKNLIRVPVDSNGGNYAITSGSLTIPSGTKLIFEGGSRLFTTGSGSITNLSDSIILLGGGVGESRGDTITKGVAVEINQPLTNTGATSTYQLNRIYIGNDRIDAETDSIPGSKVDGLLVEHHFGGTGTKGGRHAIEAFLSQDNASDLSSTDDQYVGLVGKCTTSTGDGGTSGSLKGAYFGMNSYCAISGTAQYTNHVNGCEFNSGIFGSASSKYRAGASFVSMGNSQGTEFDAAVSISTIGSLGSNIKWKDGILFGIQNGDHPCSRSLLRNESNCDTFFSTKDTIPYYLIKSDTDTKFNFSRNELKIGEPNSHLELGSTSQANTPYIDFHSSGAGTNRDARLIATGGSSTAETGTLVINAASVAFSGTVRASNDGVQNLGSPSIRWGTVYAVTGTINTSDAREKQQIRPLSEKEFVVAKKLKGLVRAFKFNDAVKEKGEKARIHVGVIAQDVFDAFQSEGLDAFEYGILCYDEWDSVAESLDKDGSVITPAKQSGNRYGVRYEELLAFIISAI